MPRKVAARRPRRRAPKRQPKRVAKLSKPMKRAIKQVVRGEAETKRTRWYQSANDGTITTKATGFASNQGWAAQNTQITLNNTDILRVIPTVLQGLDDYNRIGSKVRPVSLTVKGTIRIRFSLLNSLVTRPQNLTIDLYVLQHVRLKDYNSLYGLNDFDQLLEDGEGGTVPYNGSPLSGCLRVADENYRVLQRRRITLRYSGVVITVPSAGNTFTEVPYPQPQDHTWKADYSLNLTKHLPKVLMYPDTETDGTATSPVVLGAPTNSSIFMCMGYNSWYSPLAPFAGDLESAIEQTYVAELGFKDM